MAFHQCRTEQRAGNGVHEPDRGEYSTLEKVKYRIYRFYGTDRFFFLIEKTKTGKSMQKQEEKRQISA